MLLTKLDVQVSGLESLKSLYAEDNEFSMPYAKCSDVKAWDKYHIHDGFLFRANKLCVPECSLRLMLVQESHSGGLMGHFGREKTLLMLADHFYWPKMRRDVDRFVRRCVTCNTSKSKLKPHGTSYAYMEYLRRDRKSTRLNSSHLTQSRMPSSA